MKTIGVVFNEDKARARKELERLSVWLKEKGCTVVALPASGGAIPKLDFALSLGGDGTMLRASRVLAPHGIPIIGINLGSLGFLAETDPDEIYPFLTQVLAGDYQVEERMMLDVTLQTKEETIRQTALNDAVILSGTTGRTVTVSASVNSEFLADYIGDGLIVSTPTGSTAYSLAASGPIVHPHLSVFILTPICPHTVTQRPLIVSTGHTIRLQAKPKDGKDQPVFSIDGQLRYTIGPKDEITISVAEKPLRLIVNPQRKYFKVLRTKLKWGERG